MFYIPYIIVFSMRVTYSEIPLPIVTGYKLPSLGLFRWLSLEILGRKLTYRLIWANYMNSLTWNTAFPWENSRNPNHDSSEVTIIDPERFFIESTMIKHIDQLK